MINKKNPHLNKHMERILGNAYMRLYNAYVAAFLADGNTNGQAWYYAGGITRAILDSYKVEKSNSATEFLTDFAESHDIAIKRKSMESVYKDGYGDLNSIPENTAIKTARDELKTIIETVGATERPKFGIIKKRRTIQIPRQHGFFDWLGTYSTGTNITNLEDNPRAFAQLYRRYILRETGK